MRADAAGPTLRTSTPLPPCTLARVSSNTVMATPFMVASTPSSPMAGSKSSSLKSCAIDFPAECEGADVLAAEVGFDRAFRHERETAHAHRDHQSLAREIPAVL